MLFMLMMNELRKLLNIGTNNVREFRLQHLAQYGNVYTVLVNVVMNLVFVKC